MAGKRRSRMAGQGMTPLFDVEAFARIGDPASAALSIGRTEAQRAGGESRVVVPTPINYWVSGVFRCGDGQFTRTVQAVGMNIRLDADVQRFIAYLTVDGFQFAEGRGYLTELLGVGADDGVRITLGQ